MKNLVMFFGIIVMTGCSVLSPQKSQHINSKAIGSSGDLYTIPANLRTIDVRKKNANYIVCSEPVPDVAMSNALKLALQASKNKSASTSVTTGNDSVSMEASNALGLNGSSDASTTALELAGRTQIVLLAREFISSNCKARANGWITNPEFKTSQEKIVEQIAAMIDTDKEKAKAEKAKAEAVGAAVSAQLDKKALSNVSQAFKQAKTDSCLATYDSCIIKAGNNASKIKACRNNLGKCNN